MSTILFTHPELSIRTAQLSDLPAIVSIYNETIAGRMVTADTEPVTVSQREPWFLGHTPQRPIFVVEYQDTIVAWLSFKSFYGRPAYDGTVEISIYITKSSQGLGLGSKLLEFAENHAKTIEVTTILGFIFSHNAPSLHLFSRHGFATWGELPNVAKMDGNEYSLSILGKRI